MKWRQVKLLSRNNVEPPFYSKSRNVILKMNLKSLIPWWADSGTLLIRKDNSYSLHFSWILNIEIIVANLFVLKLIYKIVINLFLLPLMNNLMYRNFNLFHFRKSRAISTMLSFHKKVYFISLIPTNSCWMNLHKKPFFTSVLLICHNSNCYYKQDLYFWKIHVSSRKKHFHSIPKHHSTNEIDLFRIWFHYQV